MRQRRAVIRPEEEQDEADRRADVRVVRAYLPVMESFGFTDLLLKNTSGQAMPQMLFSHFEPVAGDMLDAESAAGLVCMCTCG